jgi:dCMP deaminase
MNLGKNILMKNNRISWEEFALRIAEVASYRSEDPFKKVGSCALDFNNRVIGVAYNGLVSKKEVDSNFWEDRDKRRPYMIHAETNLLSLFKKGDCKLLACTLLPCSCCATMIAAYQIKKVVYKEIYERDSKAFEIFDFYGIEHEQIIL